MSSVIEIQKITSRNKIPEVTRRLDVLPTPIELTLGVKREAWTDMSIFQPKFSDQSFLPRNSIILFRLYDPLGFVSFWLVPGRLFVQRLYKKKARRD